MQLKLKVDKNSHNIDSKLKLARGLPERTRIADAKNSTTQRHYYQLFNNSIAILLKCSRSCQLHPHSKSKIDNYDKSVSKLTITQQYTNSYTTLGILMLALSPLMRGIQGAASKLSSATDELRQTENS